MSDIDDLAFDVAFAVSHEPVGAEARKRVNSLPEEAIDQLSRVIAEHLLDRGWHREPETPVTSADRQFW